MKNITLTILTLLMAATVFAQTTIPKPKHGLSTANGATIENIELTDSTTVLCFHTTYKPGWWISIPPKTFIQPVDGKKMFIKRTEGIPLGERYTMPKSGEVRYKLIFPKLANGVSKIDYGEANDGGSWFIYDIELMKSTGSDVIPEALAGNWFNTENGKWELSLMDKQALYDSKVWNYGTVKLKKGKGSVQLLSEGNRQELFIKLEKNGNCMIGTSPKSLEAYSKTKPKASAMQANNDEPYKMPIFKTDTAIYSGYIKGYTPRAGVKTMQIHIGDIITGKQQTHLAKVNKDGYFSVKIPMYYPHAGFVRSKLFNGTIYLEPGKELFQFISNQNWNKSIFKGESADITVALNRFNTLNYLVINKIRKEILDLDQEEYKKQCLELQKKTFEKLASINEAEKLSAKAYQVLKMENQYQFLNQIMEYRWNYESAYRKKHKIPRKQRTLPEKIETPKAEFYDFITDEVANNPLAVISPNYKTFINRVKYLDILRDKSTSYTTIEIIHKLQKTGYSFTDDEKELIKRFEAIDALEKKTTQKEFWEKYSDLTPKLFNNKYRDVMQKVRKDSKREGSFYIALKKRLDEKGEKYSEEEKQFWKALIAHENKEEVQELNRMRDEIQEATSKFHAKHRSFLTGLFAQDRKSTRNENLQNKLGVQPGLATDIMDAQDACRNIVSEMTPTTDARLKDIQQNIKTPFIADYIALCNDRTKVKIQENKLKTGYTVNRTPKTDGDKLFDAMMEKFKGKVVFVDFWATWCSPCRSGIERVKPLKEEMKDEEDVVFVYITNNTSPVKAWSNMIADIKGEHFRVSADEWNYLSSKFNISGIPHYVMVDKNGKVDNNVEKLRNLSMNTTKLKEVLEKKAKE